MTSLSSTVEQCSYLVNISHLSPVTSHLSPVTSQLSPVTSHLSPVTSHLLQRKCPSTQWSSPGRDCWQRRLQCPSHQWLRWCQYPGVRPLPPPQVWGRSVSDTNRGMSGSSCPGSLWCHWMMHYERRQRLGQDWPCSVHLHLPTRQTETGVQQQKYPGEKPHSFTASNNCRSLSYEILIKETKETRTHGEMGDVTRQSSLVSDTVIVHGEARHTDMFNLFYQIINIHQLKTNKADM